MADVRILADALVAWHRTGNAELLDAYSATCLRRVWRAEHFSWWMTSMLHRLPGGDPLDLKLQLSQLQYVAASKVAAASLAENYVGLEALQRKEASEDGLNKPQQPEMSFLRYRTQEVAGSSPASSIE